MNSEGMQMQHMEKKLMNLSISLITLIGVTSLFLIFLGTFSSVEPVNESPKCKVTKPNGNTPPGENPSPKFHGGDGLWISLWRGTPSEPDEVREDGSLSMKFPWWRGVKGKLTIEGRRLDGSAPPLRSEIPDGYGDTGFQPTGLIFPTEGCWEVVGRVSDVNLKFVILVSKVKARK
jgi:hypothetical protein